MTSNTMGDTNENCDLNLNVDNDADADVDDISFHSVDTGIPSSSSPVCTKKGNTGKRKASPLLKTAVKKATPSRRSATVRRNQSSSESFLGAFNDPDFIIAITPMLKSMIAPTIQGAINQAVETAVEKIRSTILKEIKDSNKELANTIEQQNKIIADQAAQLDEKAKIITDLELKLENVSGELNKVRFSVNNLEQYGRRNSLRFSQLRVNYKLPEIELMSEVADQINEHMLTSGPKITTQDIERCHPVGKSNSPQILVKFRSYQTKHLVYSAKSRLKNTLIYVSEDLTRLNYSVIQKLQPLKKSGKIHSYWTTNGRVLAKRYETSRPTQVYHNDEVEERLHINRV